MTATRMSTITTLATQLLFLHACLATTPDTTKDTTIKPKCGVYLAPSSIPGAGFGMYAGDKEYDVGDLITLGDILVPMYEREWNVENFDHWQDEKFLWDEYYWSGSEWQMFMGEEMEDVESLHVASPGVGSAANSYLSLVNAGAKDKAVLQDRCGLSSNSPGSGAFSPYHGRTFSAVQKIPPGGELFISYGASYFKTRTKTYGWLPMRDSYKRADLIIKVFNAKRQNGGNLTDRDELWKDLWNVALSQASIWETSRTLNALPEYTTIIDANFHGNGGSAKQHYNRSIRDVSWLEENGQCMDNIKVGKSSIPDAGRGAFANRFIPKGGLVAPAPLIHIPESDALKMFQPTDDKLDKNSNPPRVTPNIDGPSTYQLMLNYCFGHQESNLLLCPYGLLTGFINHSSKNPNTRIEWSKEMRHPEWREHQVREWGTTYHAGLSFDFVALRDIEEDEEILIDYGEAWDKAWEEHVQSFIPRTEYVPAYELNEQTDQEYRTVEDRPYELDGVQLMCREWYVHKFLANTTRGDMPCQILKRLGDDQYLVQLLDLQTGEAFNATRYSTKRTGMLWDVPSAAFGFVGMPYTQDHLQFNSFRHAMMLPDDIFPEVWKDKKPRKKTMSSECGVYLAPSSIPGAGLGMFAGHRDYAVGETVTLGDVVIPIIEREWHVEKLKLKKRFLWDEYTWNGDVFPGMDEEVDDVDMVMGASPGVGSAANCYLTLVNVEDDFIKMSRGGISSTSPGSGAISPYHGRSFYATELIPAGGEIFDDYGTSYFSSRTHTYGHLPLPSSFKRADKLIKLFAQKRDTNPKFRGNEGLLDDLWDCIRGFAPIWKTSRILNALPENQTQFGDEFFEAGGSGKLHLKKSVRDLAWLKEHGQCMDNIKVGDSNNPDAGRGAFANRFIPEGGLVAPAPLVHIPDSSALKMFKPTYDKKNPERETPDIHGPMTYQLLMNYCFGHEESTLLLCPYGLLTSFINHSSKKPNTKIQWSKEMRHPEWKDQNIDSWGRTHHTGVSIDFVALRDIDEDEEILIDYGDAWEQAWNSHARTYVPRGNYIPAFELNQMENLVYRTIEDPPYEVDGLQLWCMEWYVKKFVPDVDDDIQCQILKKLGDDQYMVQLVELAIDDKRSVTNYSADEILWNVPSDAFEFGDMPYMRDHHQFEAFRHAMMVPDDMFPEAWKNK